jgi:hypothetical protein
MNEVLHTAGQDESNGTFYTYECFACDVSGIKIRKKEIYYPKFNIGYWQKKLTELSQYKEIRNFSKFIFQ